MRDIYQDLIDYYFKLESSKYSRVFLIPSLTEIFGFHPIDFNFELSTTKFPTSVFLVYLGVATNFTLQLVNFPNKLANS